MRALLPCLELPQRRISFTYRDQPYKAYRMHINKQLIAWAFCVACIHSVSAQTSPMVTKHLYDFATPGGGGYPDDDVNDHQAFVDAAAYFQARNGYGTLVLEDGEYTMGN